MGRFLYMLTIIQSGQMETMRVSNIQARENRERVIDVAAAQFREHGIEGISIANLMKAAGMTHGGFYNQFKSKDDLVVQAITRAIEGTMTDIGEHVAGSEDPLAALIRFYVSAEHRDNPAGGCSLASLAVDAARSDDPVLRKTIGDQVIRYLALLTELSAQKGGASPRHDAITTLAEMLGAVILARAVADNALSDEIIQAVTMDFSPNEPD